MAVAWRTDRRGAEEMGRLEDRGRADGDEAWVVEMGKTGFERV